MALETADHIHQLDSSNPVSTDGLAQADDHIRLIKSAIKTTFPNVTGVATATHLDLGKLSGYTGSTGDLNLLSGLSSSSVTNTNMGHLSGVSSNIQTQLDNVSSDITTLTANLASAVPTGMVMLWSGAVNAIPSGYVLCDGTNSTPDLRDRFVVGAGNDYNVAATGGASTVSLTLNQIPSHSHTYSDLYVEQTPLSPGIDIDFNSTTWDPNGSRTNGTSAAGGGASHENRPPYYALCYVMKT